MDEDWTKILQSHWPLQPQYQIKNQAGVMPIHNNTLSQQQDYVDKNYSLPAIYFSPENYKTV